MKDVSARGILRQVAEAVPSRCRERIIIIGSLAAGYHLLPDDDRLQVRTKDVDCVLSPRVEAVNAGKEIAEQLLAAGWSHRKGGPFGEPGTSMTPIHDLPAVRLCPPGSPDWYLELLTLPEPSAERARGWLRLELSTGDFGLPSFVFLPVATWECAETPFGIRCARPARKSSRRQTGAGNLQLRPSGVAAGG